MEKMTEQDFDMLREVVGVDDLDVKIIKSYNDDGKKIAQYVTTLMIYNSVGSSYVSLAKFIFITVPVFITYPIWRILFDIYRSIMEFRLNDQSK